MRRTHSAARGAAGGQLRRDAWAVHRQQHPPPPPPPCSGRAAAADLEQVVLEQQASERADGPHALGDRCQLVRMDVDRLALGSQRHLLVDLRLQHRGGFLRVGAVLLAHGGTGPRVPPRGAPDRRGAWAAPRLGPPATVVPGDGLRTPRTELGNLKSEFAEAPGGRAKQPDCGRRGASPCTPTPDAPARLLAGRGTATRTHRVPARSRRTAAGSRCR